MSIKSKIATVAIAALAITSVATTLGPRSRRSTRALVGAAIIGTTIAAASTPRYGYTRITVTASNPPEQRVRRLQRYVASATRTTDRLTVDLRPTRAPHPPRVEARPARASPLGGFSLFR